MKFCMDNYSSPIVYFERISVVLGHFPKISCVRHLSVTKTSFLRKWASTLALGIVSISETNRIKGNTESIRYISINFVKRFSRKKNHNLLFLRDQTQKTKNILKVLHICINGGFKLLVILPFIIANDLKGELLLWTATVILIKVFSFS